MSFRTSESELFGRSSLGILSESTGVESLRASSPSARKESSSLLIRAKSPSERASLDDVPSFAKSPGRKPSSSGLKPLAVSDVLESLVPKLNLQKLAVLQQSSPLMTSPVSDRDESGFSPKEPSASERRSSRFQRGKELLRESLFEEAVSYFVHAAEFELPAENSELFKARILINMAICYTGLDNIGLAYACLDEAIDICIKAKKSGAAELESIVANACFAKGILLSKQRRHDEAIEYLTKGLGVSKSECAWMIFLRGWNLFYLKQLDFAIEDFRKAKVLFDENGKQVDVTELTYDDLVDIVRNPFNFVNDEDSKEWLCECLKMKARSLSKSDNLSQSIAAIDELLSMRPDKEYYIALKATALVGLKRYEEACLQLTTAIDLNPRHAPYYVNRAYTYYKLCLFSHALRDYQSALELDGKCEEALEGIEKIMAARKKLQSKIQKAALYCIAPHEAA